MTIVEVLFVMSITIMATVALIRLMGTGFPLAKITQLQQRSTETARLNLKRMAKAIREAQPSDSGQYPLVVADDFEIQFFSDVDADESVELIRYNLSGTNLVRTVTEPTCCPVEYVQASGNDRIVARNVQNTPSEPIFIYYNGDYPDDQTPLDPTDLTEVKYIQFRLLIDHNVDVDPGAIDVRSQVQLRNLKTNLGEETGGLGV